MKVSVIIAASGRGRRFGRKGNKVFQRLKGKAVFLWSLELFVSRDDVCQTILVIHPDDLAEVKERYGANLAFMGVQIVTGGDRRRDSVANALAVVSDEAELVAVHDAARPCVSPVWVDAVIAEAAKTGAAILAYPVHGTLKKVATRPAAPAPQLMLAGESVAPASAKPRQEWVIAETVPRTDLWQAQTPQVFSRELLLRAYAGAEGAEATDEAQLVEALGEPVSVVTGDPRNIKITTPGDLLLAGAVIGSLPKPKPKAKAGPFDEAQW